MRILYLILFGFIFSFIDLLLVAIAIIQVLSSILGDGAIPSVQRFGASLGIYLRQIADFLSYASDEKPFPYSDWPQAELPVDEAT